MSEERYNSRRLSRPEGRSYSGDEEYSSNRRRSSYDENASRRRRSSEDEYASRPRRSSYDENAGRRRRSAYDEDASRSRRSSDDEYTSRRSRTSSDDRSGHRSRPDTRHSSGSRTRSAAYARNKKRKKKNRRKGRVALFILEILILFVLVGGIFVYAKVNEGLRKMDTVDTEDPNQNIDNVQINEEVAVDKVMSGYTNILLLGIDARGEDDPDYCNSDTMIICSINNDNGEIKMVSVYRDTFLNVDPDEWNFQKANAAYCLGSITQCLSMMNRNLDLNLTDYMIMDFTAVATMVDDVGGIDIDLTENEIVFMNDYCVETSEATGMPYTPIPQVAGTYTLNGVQAVSYSRIRYTEGHDLKRTQRQRLVIQKIVNKARSQGLDAINRIIDDVFPLCKTNLSNAMIIKMAAQMFGYYDIVNTCGFPSAMLTESPYVNPEYFVPVTLEQNVRELHEFLFGQTDYEPSETVKSYSQYIIDESGFDASYHDLAVGATEIPPAGSEADAVK
ncbi:MAG: LCP family protein [Lachnospiraceae bacterium]|nr:LCP family protein [Candidatus Equihabitans merdae]